MRLLVFFSLLLLLSGCELPMAEVRDLPEPPTLEVPVVVKATLDAKWINVSPATGFSIYAGQPTAFIVSTALQDTFGLQVSGGDGMSVIQSSPGVYEVSSEVVGRGYIQLDYDSIKTVNYPVMVRPVPAPVAVLGEWGNQGTIIRDNIERSLWVTLRPVDGLDKNHCKVFGYIMEKISPAGLRETASFYGNGRQDSLYHKVKALDSGDLLIFDGIRARCKGDVRVRLLNPMVFTIK